MSRGVGKTCAAAVSVGAKVIEDHVTARYLNVVGQMPMARQRVVTEGVNELAAVDAEIADVMAQVATRATPSLFERLSALQAQREELESKPPAQRIEIVDTGLTVAQWWADAHLDDQRDALAEAFAVLEVSPGKPGSRIFDPARLRAEWTPGEDLSEDL
jgi:hypothetical protein